MDNYIRESDIMFNDYELDYEVEKRLEAEMILKIKNEIAQQEKIVLENKYKFFGRGAVLKKAAKAKIKDLYQKISEMLN